MSDSKDARELERVRRLLRRLDLEEVLEDLGLDVHWYKGSEAYLDCPCPDHSDQNPSFHVCLDELEDGDGENRFGWFNCWSHPEPGLYSKNFLDLVARIRGDIWGEDEDGEWRYPTDEDRMRAAKYLRDEYLRGVNAEPDQLAVDAVRRRRRRKTLAEEERGTLVWPESLPVGDADPVFAEYLEARDYPLERAAELGVRAVEDAGTIKSLRFTVPAVLFPILVNGEAVNWYARAIADTDKKDKGRYAPGVPLANDGVLFAPEPLDARSRLVAVEGIFDRERVYRVARRLELLRAPGNVAAVLGGRIVPAQARKLRTFPEIVALVDGDEGGRIFSESVEAQLSRFTRVTVRKLPPDTDPDDAPEEAVVEALRSGGATVDDGPLFRYRYRR